MTQVFLAVYLVASALLASVSVGLWRIGLYPSLSPYNALLHLVLWVPALLVLIGWALLLRGRSPRVILWANALLWVVIGAVGVLNPPEEVPLEPSGVLAFTVSGLSLGCIGYLLVTRRR